MSNFSPFRAPQPGLPTPPTGETVAAYATYAEAQRAVDYLSDEHFPVQVVSIVGVDLRMVERVTGRLTYARAAMAGALSGIWFGLFVGLLLSIAAGASGAYVFAAMFIGAAFGLLAGVISYSLTGGRRDFTSISQIVASEYRVLCHAEHAGKAMQLLRQLPGAGRVGPNLLGPSAPAPVTPPEAGPGGYGAPSEPSGTSGYRTPSSPSTNPIPVGGPQAGSPSAPDGTPGSAEAPPVSGPTYGEMIERKKAEQRAAEAARRATEQPE
jgi:hypothetical protein